MWWHLTLAGGTLSVRNIFFDKKSLVARLGEQGGCSRALPSCSFKNDFTFLALWLEAWHVQIFDLRF